MVRWDNEMESSFGAGSGVYITPNGGGSLTSGFVDIQKYGCEK